MQAEFLCTVFLYYKKIITIPEGVWRGGLLFCLIRLKYFIVLKSFDKN